MNEEAFFTEEEFERAKEIAKRHGFDSVEDAAHALNRMDAQVRLLLRFDEQRRAEGKSQVKTS